VGCRREEADVPLLEQNNAGGSAAAAATTTTTTTNSAPKYFEAEREIELPLPRFCRLTDNINLFDVKAKARALLLFAAAPR
jgi:hypothetical protein